MSECDETRCYGIRGNVWTGPLYCGNRAKQIDDAGRPTCGVCKDRFADTVWDGDRGRYPHGSGGRWEFARGTRRKQEQ